MPSDVEIHRALEFWTRASEDNLQTAKAMLRSARYNFAMFMCQQSIEALLKALYIKHKHDRPPHIHKLPRLLDLVGIRLPLAIDRKILLVDAHYIKARYKEDRFDPKIYNRKNASALLHDTAEVMEWLRKQLD